MITKVLVAEDHALANESVQKALLEQGVTQVDHVYYCDDALQKIRNSKLTGQPYDLLITDLNFEDDGSTQEIRDGINLIELARQQLPGMKVIVFSIENKPSIIEALFEVNYIDGYVRKSRNDSYELKNAMASLNRNQRYFPRHLVQSVQHKNTYQFSDVDIAIIGLLASGVSQKNIPFHLQQKGLHPSSLSSVEKKLNQMKSTLDCSKNEQLVAFCKDMGII